MYMRGGRGAGLGRHLVQAVDEDEVEVLRVGGEEGVAGHAVRATEQRIHAHHHLEGPVPAAQCN